MILRATGWYELFEGTLSLEVHPEVVTRLKASKPLIREPGESVRYPEEYAHIPVGRGAYLYYRATVQVAGRTADVLIRTAANPLKGRLEAFAPTKLRDSLGVSDGDEVTCETVE